MKSLNYFAAILSLLWASNSVSAVIYQTGFEAPEYSVGDVSGQNGWVTDIGPTDRVRVRDDIPKVGLQSLWAASGGGGVTDTRAIRDLSYDATYQTLNLSSRVIFTTGVRSDWEFMSVFGSSGFLGGLRVVNDEFVLHTSLASIATGIFTGGFPTISVEFDFRTGLAFATHNGATIASGIAFDSSNSQITQVAALRLITANADAVALDEFSVTATPEPTTLALIGLGIVGLRIRKKYRS